ncbi:MAG: ATP-binding cassette domain-containing protein [Candidatus Hermodarchaeota archaeon]
MVNKIIETFDLTKIYKLKGKSKSIKALNNVNISIEEGEIFGLLGPNGAGKTTMISILTTLLQPTNGYAIVDGFNILKKPKRAKSRISLMLGSDILYYRITGYDNLKFFCRLYLIPNYNERIRIMAKEFGLENWLNEYVEKYSSGMKMKLALLRTLLLDRKILFLDEPTLGLDVKMVKFVIDKLKESKKTIFITSHDMNVVEKLCDRVAFINYGEILNIGTQREVKQLIRGDIRIKVVISKNKTQLAQELNKQKFVEKTIDNENGLIINIKKRENYGDLFSILKNYSIQSIEEQQPSLEDLFLKLI